MRTGYDCSIIPESIVWPLWPGYASIGKQNWPQAKLKPLSQESLSTVYSWQLQSALPIYKLNLCLLLFHTDSPFFGTLSKITLVARR